MQIEGEDVRVDSRYAAFHSQFILAENKCIDSILVLVQDAGGRSGASETYRVRPRRLLGADGVKRIAAVYLKSFFLCYTLATGF